MKPCLCGCGELIEERDKNGPIYYKHSHVRRGKKHSLQTRQKIASSNRYNTMVGSNHPRWKGDDINKQSSLHQWVRRHKPIPEYCEECNVKPVDDLANLSGMYLRDFNDWKYLCRVCHFTMDKVWENSKHDPITGRFISRSV